MNALPAKYTAQPKKVKVPQAYHRNLTHQDTP
jgi:hypothetical protein